MYTKKYKMNALHPFQTDFDTVKNYFSLSEKDKQYSNFGPCEKLLRSRLCSLVGAMSLDHIITFQSATSAIENWVLLNTKMNDLVAVPN